MIYNYRGATIIYSNITKDFMISGFGESYSSLKEAKEGVDDWLNQGIIFEKV